MAQRGGSTTGNGNPTTLSNETGTYSLSYSPFMSADHDQIMGDGSSNIYAYDGDGNATSWKNITAMYDKEDRLYSYASPTSVTAAYDSDGLRAWKQPGSGATTYYVYDGETPVEEVTGSGTFGALYTYGDAGLASQRTTTSTYYEYDPQGNVAHRLDSSSSLLSSDVYDAWGNALLAGSTTDPVGFGGQYGYYTDQESGLVLLGHRYYDPTRGRFLNRDPIGYNGGINLYSYVGDNPVNWADPSGFSTIPNNCTDLENEINNLEDEITGRYWKMRNDLLGGNKFPLWPWRNIGTGHNPGSPGSGTWQGHQEQFQNKQKRLRELLKKYNDLGCGGQGGGQCPSSNAWQWATKPVPVRPRPEQPTPGQVLPPDYVPVVAPILETPAPVSFEFEIDLQFQTPEFFSDCKYVKPRVI